MKNPYQRLSMAQSLKYRIEVQGRIEERWLAWFDRMELTGIKYEEGVPVTTLTGILADQAALQGLLRKLYDRGFLLLRVTYLYPCDDIQSNSLSSQD